MPTQIELIKKYGLSIRGHLGQHLLIDPNLQRKIVDLLEIEPSDSVVEIGPGLGALTAEILKQAKKVWVIEKDPRFIDVLKQEFKTQKNLEIIHSDILKVDFKKIGKNTRAFKVIGNLPYYITAPILFHLLDFSALISKCVVMMQKEVADRLTASPGTKSYGRLSILMRYLANVRHEFDVSPGCFTPRPEVDSSVLSLTFNPATARLPQAEEKIFLRILTTAFSQRRKTLLHLLSHDPELKLDRETLAQTFESFHWTKTVRGEELLLKDFLDLTHALKGRRA